MSQRDVRPSKGIVVFHSSSIQSDSSLVAPTNADGVLSRDRSSVPSAGTRYGTLQEFLYAVNFCRRV
jgi:hypothetical protein